MLIHTTNGQVIYTLTKRAENQAIIGPRTKPLKLAATNKPRRQMAGLDAAAIYAARRPEAALKAQATGPNLPPHKASSLSLAAIYGARTPEAAMQAKAEARERAFIDPAAIYAARNKEN